MVMAEDGNQRRRRLLQAWNEWAPAVLSAVLLQELEAAAHEVQLDPPRLAAEVIECYCAARRLPRMATPMAARPGKLGAAVERESEDQHFPWPAETYRVQL
jgi:hypothetical protein